MKTVHLLVHHYGDTTRHIGAYASPELRTKVREQIEKSFSIQASEDLEEIDIEVEGEVDNISYIL